MSPDLSTMSTLSMCRGSIIYIGIRSCRGSKVSPGMEVCIAVAQRFSAVTSLQFTTTACKSLHRSSYLILNQVAPRLPVGCLGGYCEFVLAYSKIRSNSSTNKR